MSAQIREVALLVLAHDRAGGGGIAGSNLRPGESEVVKWTAFLMRDPVGDLTGMAAITMEQLRAEVSLVEKLSWLKAASDLVGLTSYQWEPQTGALHWDEGLKALWGLPADADVTEAVWLEGIHPDDRDRVLQAVAQSIDPAKDGVYATEYRVIGREDGIERWISARGQAVFEGGIPVSFTGAVLDITPQKQAEAQLRRSEAYLATILRQLPVGVGVFDLQGRLTLGNPALDRFATKALPSRDPGERPKWRAFRPDGSALSPGDYPGERALRGETPVPPIDFLHSTQEGADLWVRVSSAPLLNDDDSVQGVVSIFQDIDRQRRAEEGLRESEARFRRFAEHSGDVIWIHDLITQRLEYLSPGFERIVGKPVETAPADHNVLNGFLHPDDRTAAAQSLARVFSGGEAVTQEYRIVRPDGVVRWIRHTAFPIRNGEGRLVQIGGVAQDVTRKISPNVYLIEPDPKSRSARSTLMRGAGHRVTAFASECAFLDVAGALAPGCVVVRADDASPGRFDLGLALKKQRITLPVIFETVLAGAVGLAIGAMKAGATDILEAPCDGATLLAAVAAALASTEEAAEEVREGETARAQVAQMSVREREVLEGLLAGGTNKSIARDLGLSPRTVENYRARAMEHLGVRTLPEAVLAAAAAGVKPSRGRSPTAD